MLIDNNRSEIEKSIIEALLSRATWELDSGNILDAIGLFGIAFDCYPWNEQLRTEVPIIIDPIRTLKDAAIKKALSRLDCDLSSEPAEETEGNSLLQQGLTNSFEFKHLPNQIKAFLDGTETNQRNAEHFLRNLGAHAEKVVHALFPFLLSEGVQQRERVGQVLVTIGRQAVVPLIKRSLNNNDLSCGIVVQILREMGTAVDEGMPFLVKALFNCQVTVRRRSAWMLRYIPGAAQSAVPALIKAVCDDQAVVRVEVALALGQVHSPSEDAVRALMNALDDNQAAVRHAAISALGEIGENAFAALPVLEKALRDQEVSVREKAVWALGEIGSPAVLRPLQTALRDDQGIVRQKASEAIKRIVGANGRTSVPLLSVELEPSTKELIAQISVLLQTEQPHSSLR